MADWPNRTRALASGLTLSFNDELEAALRSGRISGPEYRSARDSIRKNYGAYEKANPYEAGGQTRMLVHLGRCSAQIATGRSQWGWRFPSA